LTTEDIVKKITGLASPDSMVAEIALPEMKNLRGAAPILILDKISDPGNLGTLLRSALAFGYKGAFILEGSADPFNDKALRAAKGATFHLPLALGSWEECRQMIDLPFYFGDTSGSKALPTGPHALVLSNETHGPSPEIRKAGIPLHIATQNVESLNVAVAGSILMHQMGGV